MACNGLIIDRDRLPNLAHNNYTINWEIFRYKNNCV